MPEANATTKFKAVAKVPVVSQKIEPPEAGRAHEVDASSDPRKAWKCLQVRRSKIANAGRGLFALCPLQKETLLGEYRGERFLMGQTGTNKRLQADWEYTWKVPRCLKGPKFVVTRAGRETAHSCSNLHGYVYVDAKPLDDEATNPLRFVNGVVSKPHGQTRRSGGNQGRMETTPVNASVEAFFADDRVFYHTLRAVAEGEELVVDYGEGYWRAPGSAEWEQRGAQSPQNMVADWGDFVSDDSD